MKTEKLSLCQMCQDKRAKETLERATSKVYTCKLCSQENITKEIETPNYCQKCAERYEFCQECKISFRKVVTY